MKEIYQINTRLATDEKQVIRKGNFRFTVLREGVLRVEYQPEQVFCDLPTQKVTKRETDGARFEVKDNSDRLEIETVCFKMEVNTSEDSLSSLRIKVKGLKDFVWKYGDKADNLGGTVRTLDRINGSIPLGEGLMSRDGIGVLDDSESYMIEENGFLGKRAKGTIDLYLFVYGNDYKKCLKDFFAISGETPLLPRFALGNWWSRYHRYDEKEYKELIENFEKHEIPLSVGVVDMDWHITNPPIRFGGGWTGYTWNRDLFPAPKEFLDWIHEKNLKVSLNVHPADGVRAYEDAYPAIADRMGVNKEKEEPVRFNPADPNFIEAYMDCVHHPLEEDGVDFWWIDWQQGTKTKLPGLDPLWVLNHYHTLDNTRYGKRPMILSRFAKIGSHRYPIGFSGDSIISWKSLRFQPYFTSTASNVGYCWWSHDIGGHMKGISNEELQVRWVQYGVFSPIMRLHCSASPFNHKEPWSYHKNAECIISDFMRLRHRLIPYMYTMNERLHTEGEPLITPMYYDYPQCKESYECNNEYTFGSEMICLPMTSAADRRTLMANEEFWFPEGKFVDLFTGTIYHGNRKWKLFRPMNEMPVLLKAGAIVPLAGDVSKNGTENPSKLSLVIAMGADNSFKLYEDDGESLDYKNNRSVTTTYLQNFTEGRFSILPAEGDLSFIPAKRSYQLKFMGSACPDKIFVLCKGKRQEVKYRFNEYKNIVETEYFDVVSKEGAIVLFEGGMKLAKNLILHKCFEILDAAAINFLEKEKIMDKLNAELRSLEEASADISIEVRMKAIKSAQSVCTCKKLMEALSEIILAD